MPIYLDEVPEDEDNISRPVILRWVILLIVILFVGVVLTLWQWTGDRRGVLFWLTALGLPFTLWGILAVFRHIGYRPELNGEAGWNFECESLKDMEIAPGQCLDGKTPPKGLVQKVPVWLPFLNNLTKDAPEWKTCSEAYIEKMVWMQDATTEKLGPSLWHMHPIVFLGEFHEKRKLIWIKIVEQRFGRDIAESLKQKVISVGAELSIDPDYIMACMALETGTKFNTSMKNPNSSATGLIQFMENTAKDLGTTTTKLSKMTHVEQMDYVKKYFNMQAANFNYPTKNWSLGDVYLSIFTSSAMLIKDTDTVYASGQKAYAVNLFHDRNKDGKITKAEIVKNIDGFYKDGFKYAG
ncbi:hypothetical protein ACGVWS_06195 [Enterobacteriaceae bacterium LUAb1]